MNEELARNLTYTLALICVVIEIFEIYRSRVKIEQLWPWNILKLEFDAFSSRFLSLLFEQFGFARFLMIYLVLVAFTALFQTSLLWIVVCIFHLLLTLRFRGRWNGGSDAMVFQVLFSCVLLSIFKNHSSLKFFGFYYLALNLVISYFIAGLSKITQKNWRNGESLKRYFLLTDYPIPMSMKLLVNRPQRLAYLAWSLMVFELTFAFSVFNFAMALFAVFLGIGFHFANFLTFGLNRFFWAWIATYPSILFISSKLANNL